MDFSPFSPFPALETARLSLGRLSQADAPGIFALRSDPDVIRYTGIPRYTDPAQAFEYVARMGRDTDAGKSAVWSVRLRETGEFLGSVCLWNIAWDEGAAEIGYDLLPPRQGKGYMREAANAVLTYGFTRMGLKRVFADLCADNIRSVRLLESCGFARRKLQAGDGSGARMALYVLEKDAWRTRAANAPAEN